MSDLTKWQEGKGLWGSRRWIRKYDGAIISEYELLRFISDEVLTAALKAKLSAS